MYTPFNKNQETGNVSFSFNLSIPKPDPLIHSPGGLRNWHFQHPSPLGVTSRPLPFFHFSLPPCTHCVSLILQLLHYFAHLFGGNGFWTFLYTIKLQALIMDDSLLSSRAERSFNLTYPLCFSCSPHELFTQSEGVKKVKWGNDALSSHIITSKL